MSWRRRLNSSWGSCQECRWPSCGGTLTRRVTARRERWSGRRNATCSAKLVRQPDEAEGGAAVKGRQLRPRQVVGRLRVAAGDVAGPSCALHVLDEEQCETDDLDVAAAGAQGGDDGDYDDPFAIGDVEGREGVAVVADERVVGVVGVWLEDLAELVAGGAGGVDQVAESLARGTDHAPGLCGDGARTPWILLAQDTEGLGAAVDDGVAEVGAAGAAREGHGQAVAQRLVLRVVSQDGLVPGADSGGGGIQDGQT